MLDIDVVVAETRRTSHSTLGLIAALQQVLSEDAAEWVYYGATVQDVTDTWTALAVRKVSGVMWRDLRRIEDRLLRLAAEHRDTVIAGRTHGQAGAPTTFGLKVASWADEIRRHVDRLREGGPRWFVGQLAGAVGSLAFYGDGGTALRQRFCARLGLADPGVSWTSSRDRVAEFGSLLALVTGTLARIGTEVYQLQRSEIDELREPAPAGRSAASRCRTNETPKRASTSRRWRGWCAPLPPCWWKASWPSTNGMAGPGRPSGSPSPRLAC